MDRQEAPKVGMWRQMYLLEVRRLALAQLRLQAKCRREPRR